MPLNLLRAQRNAEDTGRVHVATDPDMYDHGPGFWGGFQRMADAMALSPVRMQDPGTWNPDLFTELH